MLVSAVMTTVPVVVGSLESLSLEAGQIVTTSQFTSYNRRQAEKISSD